MGTTNSFDSAQKAALEIAEKSKFYSGKKDLSVEFLESGSYGIVFSICSQKKPLGDIIKISKPNLKNDAEYNIKRESDILKQYKDCKNIVSIKSSGSYEYNSTQRLYFYIAEQLEPIDNNVFYIDNGRDGKPRYYEAEVYRFIMDISQALCDVEYVSSKGGYRAVHRDIKLNNILVKLDENGQRILYKLIDFGILKQFEHETMTGTEPMGTPYTISPEQLLKKPTERSDIYSLAAVLYELLSAEHHKLYELSKKELYSDIDSADTQDVLSHLYHTDIKEYYSSDSRTGGIFPDKVLFDKEHIDGSEDLRNLLRSMLALDYNDRPTAKEVQVEILRLIQKHGSAMGISTEEYASYTGYKEFKKLSSKGDSRINTVQGVFVSTGVSKKKNPSEKNTRKADKNRKSSDDNNIVKNEKTVKRIGKVISLAAVAEAIIAVLLSAYPIFDITVGENRYYSLLKLYQVNFVTALIITILSRLIFVTLTYYHFVKLKPVLTKGKRVFAITADIVCIALSAILQLSEVNFSYSIIGFRLHIYTITIILSIVSVVMLATQSRMKDYQIIDRNKAEINKAKHFSVLYIIFCLIAFLVLGILGTDTSYNEFGYFSSIIIPACCLIPIIITAKYIFRNIHYYSANSVFVDCKDVFSRDYLLDNKFYCAKNIKMKSNDSSDNLSIMFPWKSFCAENYGERQGNTHINIDIEQNLLKHSDDVNNAELEELHLQGYKLAETNFQNELLQGYKLIETNFLNELPDLRILSLPDNSITDVSDIAQLEHLEEVNLDNNAIKRIDKKWNSLRIKKFSCANNNIDPYSGGLSDLSGLSNLTVLQSFNCRNNQLAELRFLSKSKAALTQADISENNLTQQEIELALSGCTELKKLSIDSKYQDKEQYKLTSLDFLSEFDRLEEFSAANGNIEDISPLSDKSIRKLNLSNNKIKDISMLDKIISLYDSISLNLSSNKISDISKLPRRHYAELNLSGNPISDLSRLNDMSGDILKISYNESNPDFVLQLSCLRQFSKVEFYGVPLDKRVVIEDKMKALEKEYSFDSSVSLAYQKA